VRPSRATSRIGRGVQAGEDLLGERLAFAQAGGAGVDRAQLLVPGPGQLAVRRTPGAPNITAAVGQPSVQSPRRALILSVAWSLLIFEGLDPSSTQPQPRRVTHATTLNLRRDGLVGTEACAFTGPGGEVLGRTPLQERSSLVQACARSSITARYCSAMAAARRLPPVRQNAWTRSATTAARSDGRYRMRSSFMRTGEPCSPASSSHSVSATPSSAGMPVHLGQRVQPQPRVAEQCWDLTATEAAVQEQVRQALRVAGRHGQAATRVAIRTASSSCARGMPYCSATTSSGSPAQNSANASSRRAPPRAKIGCPKPRAASTTTSATS
jgi:hypothetical protein